MHTKEQKCPYVILNGNQRTKTPVCYTECKPKNNLRTWLQFTMHAIIVYNFSFRDPRHGDYTTSYPT